MFNPSSSKPPFASYKLPQKSGAKRHSEFLESSTKTDTKYNVGKTFVSMSYPKIIPKRKTYHKDRTLQIDLFTDFPRDVVRHLRSVKNAKGINSQLTTNKFQDITGGVTESGITWLLHGKNLFVWKAESTRTGNKIIWQYTLEVPLSGGGCFVTIVENDEAMDDSDEMILDVEKSDDVGLLAISSEGALRYWPKISGKYQEYSIDLNNASINHISNCKKVPC